MSATLPAVTTATFDEEVGGSDLPVLVDLWAEWCGPCKLLDPVLESIAADHAERLRIVTVDGDAEPDLVRRFDVMSFPTLLLFRDGELVRRLVGARGKGHLLEELAAVL
jgi:thioredoxin 1